MEVDYSEFYYLEDPFFDYAYRIGSRDHDAQQALELFWGIFNPTKPVIYKAYQGGKAADFLWGWFGVCVSTKIIDLLTTNKLEGWTTYPVEVYDRAERLLPGYHGFAVTSYAGERQIERSPIVESRPLFPGGKTGLIYKGIFFDEALWNGSDVFRVGNGIIVVTQKVRDILTINKIRNIGLVRLSEHETSLAVYNKLQK